MKHVLSLGAGVQSSTLALMAAHGEVTPMPDVAVFADTGWEPRAVYDWLDWLETTLPFPVARVSAGNIREDQLKKRRSRPSKVSPEMKKAGRFASMPYYTQNGGMIRRQCTSEYKIEPIERYVKREVLGLRPRQRTPKAPVVTTWRGISADESYRLKPSSNRWELVRYPLAMEHQMTRADCLNWMARQGYPRPARSACIGCPYHSDDEWREIQRRPEEWAQAVEFDRAIRYSAGLVHATFLHRSCQPLDEIDFSAGNQMDLWGEECDGVCGV